MFAGSSRGLARQNPDGSWNTYCYQCQRFIAKSFMCVPRALCILCQAVEEGKALPADFIQQYEASKLEKADIGMLNLSEPESPMPKKKKFSFDSVGGPILRALGRFGLAEHGDQEKKHTQPSVQVARGKRRPRLFSKGQLTDTGENPVKP